MKDESKKKRSYAERQQKLRQIFCLVLAVLMILGIVAAVVPYLAMNVSAADFPASEPAEGPAPADPQIPATEEDKEPDEGLLLRIGLMFGSGVTPSFAVRSANGFVFSSVDDKTDAQTFCFSTKETHIAVCQDNNLTRTEDGFYLPASDGVVIGGYHLQLPASYADQAALEAAVASVNQKLSDAGIYSSLIYAFPAYINGSLCVRIGDFGSGDSAQAKSALVASAVGETPTVIYPVSEAMTVLAPDKNLILFEHQKNGSQLGADPLHLTDAQTGKSLPAVIETPAENTYEGTFLFGRYKDGISVTNLIPLEQYVAGVVPYEISNTWSYECIKAFAIIVRSYTLSNRSKHSSLGIDLCNGTDCQVYMGTKKQNEAVLRAVDETRGLVITYDDKICSTIYSAVTGGCTVNVEQIWNGRAYPYLRAVETPWEDYASHRYGEWLSEVSGQELFSYLNGKKGYTQLKGAVTDVSIEELAENSTYVYRLKITDCYGNSVMLKGTDIIRTTLGRYLKSANFVVAKDGVIPILDKTASVLTPSGTKPLPVGETADGRKTMEILTADGIKTIDITTGLPVLQADGSQTLLTEGVYDLPKDALSRVEDPDNHNFIFIGRGWGHGGGISQWGAKNMAEAGAFYDEIIHAYFTGVEIQDYRALPQ